YDEPIDVSGLASTAFVGERRESGADHPLRVERHIARAVVFGSYPLVRLVARRLVRILDPREHDGLARRRLHGTLGIGDLPGREAGLPRSDETYRTVRSDARQDFARNLAIGLVVVGRDRKHDSSDVRHEYLLHPVID